MPGKLNRAGHWTYTVRQTKRGAEVAARAARKSYRIVRVLREYRGLYIVVFRGRK